LDWLQIFQFAMSWVGLNHLVDGLGWFGSWKMDARTTLLP